MSNENDLIAATYDNAPYLSCSFDFSAPENLRSVAWLFGLDTPAPATARVLELGCAGGGNLIPFAQRHPGASAVGVDLSAAQVAEGNALIARLGLDNVRLEHRDLMQLAPDFGQFDYIVCHGVYSWVPGEVRHAILRICRENLAPEGVAMISYNTYPGWKTREIVRDAMVLHGRGRGAPLEELAHARGMLDFLRERVVDDSLLGRVLGEYGSEITKGDDYYLVHEYLERHNQPCYFRDFAEAAGAHGLAYLAETQVTTMFVSNLGKDTADALRAVCRDQVTLEQYLDFLRNRQFRQTLLVPAEREAQIVRTLDPARLAGLYYRGHFSDPVASTAEKTSFQTHRRGRVDLSGAMTLAAADLLTAAYPNALQGQALIDEISRRGLLAEGDVAAEVSGLLGQLIAFNAVEFQRQPWQSGAPRISARPAASPLARDWFEHRFAAADAPAKRWVVSPSHQTIWLDVVARVLLPLLDGTRTHAQLARAVVVAHERGELTLARAGTLERLETAEDVRASAREMVADALDRLWRQNLLVA